MFQRLFKRAESAAESAIDQIVAKYTGRLMAAIPLLIAAGFATAALAIKMVELYGAVTGYGLMAALFAVIGLFATAIVGIRSRTTPQAAAAEEPVAAAAEPEAAADDPFDTSLLTPEVKAILASLAPVAVPGIARGVVKNLPLLLILAVVGLVISRFTGISGGTPGSDAGAAGDGAGSSGDTGAADMGAGRGSPLSSDAPIPAAA
jgi:hypothetical protein